MKTRIDTSKEYGLVLEGGGAKGAFQIGAWKALVKAGVRIRGIAGTSVGGLNGALIAAGEVSEAEALWENMTYSQVMDVNDEDADAFLNGRMSLRERLDTVREIIRPNGSVKKVTKGTIWRKLLPVRRYLLWVYRKLFVKK